MSAAVTVGRWVRSSPTTTAHYADMAGRTACGWPGLPTHWADAAPGGRHCTRCQRVLDEQAARVAPEPVPPAAAPAPRRQVAHRQPRIPRQRAPRQHPQPMPRYAGPDTLVTTIRTYQQQIRRAA